MAFVTATSRRAAATREVPVIGGHGAVLRRSRGGVPHSVGVDRGFARPVLACGTLTICPMQYATQRPEDAKVAVQHHHAHVISAMAEHDIDEPGDGGTASVRR